MGCKGCGKDVKIVNKFWHLCLICNKSRLSEGKEPKKYNYIKKKTKSRTSKKKDKTKRMTMTIDSHKKLSMKQKDEIFYEKCFNNSDHRCEECGKELPKQFRDADGKIIARYRYSHTIPKSIAPELRHEIMNINHLCLKDHSEWENGNKEKMKIFKKNVKNFPQFLERFENKGS